MRSYEKEIIIADNKRLDEVHKNFIETYEDKLSDKELELIKEVFDFIKKN